MSRQISNFLHSLSTGISRDSNNDPEHTFLVGLLLGLSVGTKNHIISNILRRTIERRLGYKQDKPPEMLEAHTITMTDFIMKSVQEAVDIPQERKETL